MLHRCAVVLLLVSCVTTAARADLKTYVEKPDASFSYRLVAAEAIGEDATGYVLRMTSQTWRGVRWEHWVSLIVPKVVKHPDKAILAITGGSSQSRQPDGKSGVALMLGRLAQQTGAILIVVQQVPNQPLFGRLYEDDLISYTFDKYLTTGERDWPLLFPMVKSATAAMTAAQRVVKQRFGHDLKGFIVTGASKRGWTTWLTAAIDQRVVAIAPMVIDMLNTGPQLNRQLASYGRFSRMIEPYVARKIPQRFDTPRGKQLTDMVDPYVYRDRVNVPKLVLLGTNDPYWTVDAANLYFGGLKGVKHLYYEPNAGHGLGQGIFPTLGEFFAASLQGKTLPAMSWKRDAPNKLTVKWDNADTPGQPTVTMWQATSDNRDFRNARWTPTLLQGDGQITVQADVPKAGWTAFYVTVNFPGRFGAPFGLTTRMVVLPETFPHDPAQIRRR